MPDVLLGHTISKAKSCYQIDTRPFFTASVSRYIFFHRKYIVRKRTIWWASRNMHYDRVSLNQVRCVQIFSYRPICQQTRLRSSAHELMGKGKHSPNEQKKILLIYLCFHSGSSIHTPTYLPRFRFVYTSHINTHHYVCIELWPYIHTYSFLFFLIL